ncbi:MAG: phage tail protein, partial [Deltaproteobacteria bacterium]|nr:phage tail protein [Deltaproteobacteria bacterium]
SDKSASPTNKIPGPATTTVYSPSAADVSLAAGTVASSGGSQAHNNLQPYLAVKCCISLSGIYPTQN